MTVCLLLLIIDSISFSFVFVFCFGELTSSVRRPALVSSSSLFFRESALQECNSANGLSIDHICLNISFLYYPSESEYKQTLTLLDPHSIRINLLMKQTNIFCWKYSQLPFLLPIQIIFRLSIKYITITPKMSCFWLHRNNILQVCITAKTIWKTSVNAHAEVMFYPQEEFASARSARASLLRFIHGGFSVVSNCIPWNGTFLSN